MISCAVPLLLTTATFPGVDDRAWEALQKMFAAWEAADSLTYDLRKQERLRGGKVVRDRGLVKIRKPLDSYILALEPHPGQEIIYNPRIVEGELIVHPGYFPDLTLSLSIYGRLTTEDQHHIVTHGGFGYLMQNMGQAMARILNNHTGERVEWGGETMFAGRKVVRVVVHAGNAPHRRVRCKEDESLFAFARRLRTDPYLIVYHNDDIELDDDVDSGQTYVVPRYYGGKIELLLDAENHLPLKNSVWDFDGRLYERYEYWHLDLNPNLSDIDFSPDNPAYNF